MRIQKADGSGSIIKAAFDKSAQGTGSQAPVPMPLPQGQPGQVQRLSPQQEQQEAAFTTQMVRLFEQGKLTENERQELQQRLSKKQQRGGLGQDEAGVLQKLQSPLLQVPQGQPAGQIPPMQPAMAASHIRKSDGFGDVVSKAMEKILK